MLLPSVWWAVAFAAGESKTGLDGVPIVCTQVPLSASERPVENRLGAAAVAQQAFQLVSEGSRLILIAPGRNPQILTRDFHSAADTDVSFDGKRILFAAKPTADACWGIYELSFDGSRPRPVVTGVGNCRVPSYQSQLFTLDAPEPWAQITFASDASQEQNEAGTGPVWELYSCRMDGSEVRRLTFTLSCCLDPWMVPDGRIVFAAWFRRHLFHGTVGKTYLMGINLDGTDYAIFGDPSGLPFKRMPCYLTSGLVVFVEGERLGPYGSGRLGMVSYRRPLKSYRPLTGEQDGLFHSPAPLPDGGILVAHRPPDRPSFGIWRLDPLTGAKTCVFDDPNYDELQPRALAPRDLPDGRSSVVESGEATGKLYCLTVRISDLPREWWPPGEKIRLRILEGVPLRTGEQGTFWGFGPLSGGGKAPGIGAVVARRFLGEFDVEEDGSFQAEVPADIPLELQLIDSRGVSLRSCGWIWVKPKENRGCIGCHEDGELTPPNDFPKALGKAAVALTLPPERRRITEFVRDVWPIVKQKCLPCHGPEGSQPILLRQQISSGDDSLAAADQHLAWEVFCNLLRPLDGAARSAPGSEMPAWVHPGSSRTSPLMWHIFGENLCRPWDGRAAAAPVKSIPESSGIVISPEERSVFAEWIDLGAVFQRAPERQ
jgi:hypothetical protein